MIFSATVSDPCVYAEGTQERYAMLTLYIDDILISSINILQHVQDMLKVRFCISRKLGQVSLILGMEIVRDETQGTFTLSQQKHVGSMLKYFVWTHPNQFTRPGLLMNSSMMHLKTPCWSRHGRRNTKRWLGVSTSWPRAQDSTLHAVAT